MSVQFAVCMGAGVCFESDTVRLHCPFAVCVTHRMLLLLCNRSLRVTVWRAMRVLFAFVMLLIYRYLNLRWNALLAF